MEPESDKAAPKDGTLGDALRKRLGPLWYCLIFGGLLSDHFFRHHSWDGLDYPLAAFLAMSVVSVISPNWITRLIF
jgi:hypothetical protein